MTAKSQIKTIAGVRADLREYSFQSEKRAELACIEARALLRAFIPNHDFNPAELIQVKGKILIAPAGFPITLN